MTVGDRGGSGTQDSQCWPRRVLEMWTSWSSLAEAGNRSHALPQGPAPPGSSPRVPSSSDWGAKLSPVTNAGPPIPEPPTPAHSINPQAPQLGGDASSQPPAGTWALLLSGLPAACVLTPPHCALHVASGFQGLSARSRASTGCWGLKKAPRLSARPSVSSRGGWGPPLCT